MKKILSIVLLCLWLLMAVTPVMADNNYINQERGLAETLLANLARQKKTGRLIGGVTLTTVGVGTGVLVATLDENDFEEEDDAKVIKPVGYLAAGVMAGAGIMVLAMPSEAESQYQDLKMIEDPIKREQTALNSLIYFAEKAKSERLTAGITTAASALCIALGQPLDLEDDNISKDANKYSAISLAATAGISLFLKSPEEKMLDQYYQGKEMEQSHSSFNLGWLPNGQITAVYSYRF